MIFYEQFEKCYHKFHQEDANIVVPLEGKCFEDNNVVDNLATKSGHFDLKSDI